MTNTTLRMVATLLMVVGFAVLTDAVAFPSHGDAPPSVPGYDAPALPPLRVTTLAEEQSAPIAVDPIPIPPAPAAPDGVPEPVAPMAVLEPEGWCDSDDTCLVDSDADAWCEAEASCP